MGVICKWLVLLAAAVICTTQAGRPHYISCLNSGECAKDECCVIGMGRFSIPSCRPRMDVGEDCRPYGEPINTTLEYPDHTVVEFTDVYQLMCPCLGGLKCDNSGDYPQCQESRPSNHIYQFSEELMEDY